MENNGFSYGLTIKKITESIGREANSNLLTLGVTVSQLHMLMSLHRAEGHTLPLKALESDFCMAQSTIAGLANRLEKKQLVAPVTVSGDKRVKHIRLTDAGEALLNKAHSNMQAVEQRLIGGMTAEEAEAFRALLLKAYFALNPLKEESADLPGKDHL
ncbi:MAG: MarR family transcriptional regulator [Clostridia bacterium]|nr:MarR family transcriptional regulator [Clostridia bacterium]